VATDTAMTTEKSYWGKSREGKTKQVKFKTLFEYSQRWGRGDVVACSKCGLRLLEKLGSRRRSVGQPEPPGHPTLAHNFAKYW